jgi:hypothetical protein
MNTQLTYELNRARLDDLQRRAARARHARELTNRDARRLRRRERS